MNIHSVFSIAFVPTAGALKEVCWKTRGTAAFWTTWPIFKKWLKNQKERGYVFVKSLDELKPETIARLDAATELFQGNRIDTLFLSGGKTGQRPKEKDSVAMMAHYLFSLGIDDKAVVLDRDTLQTTDKVEAFVKYLEKIDSDITIIWVVTSWYHLPRTLYLLRKALAKSPILTGKHVTIHRKAVFPPLTRRCLEYEYLYNLAAELVGFATINSEIIRNWWRERETMLRNINQKNT